MNAGALTHSGEERECRGDVARSHRWREPYLAQRLAGSQDDTRKAALQELQRPFHWDRRRAHAASGAGPVQ